MHALPGLMFGHAHLDNACVPSVQVGCQPSGIQTNSSTNGNDGFLPPALSYITLCEQDEYCHGNREAAA
jgi:hypothetical protein